MGNRGASQYVDVEVTRKKFEKELQEFKELEAEYNKRGVFCIESHDFLIQLLFSVPHLKPSPIAFAVELDYSNWDFEPPSLKLIDPFTKAVLRSNEISIQFLQWNNESGSPQPLLVGLEIPFLCVPGIREYHQHQHHSGDSWMLYRTKGEGKLVDVIEKLIKHSISLILGYLVNVNGHVIVFNTLQLMSDITKIPR